MCPSLDGTSDKISVGLHQGSAQNPCLLTVIMDKLTKEFQHKIFYCMLFSNYIVLVDESKDLICKLGSWREPLNRKKKSYQDKIFNCNFDIRTQK